MSTDQTPPAVDRAALRDRIAEALDSLQGTAHHLPPETRKRVIEVVTAAVLPAPVDRAELDSLGRESDRLRKAWVEMRDRAERIEAEVERLRTDRAAVLSEAADVLDNSETLRDHTDDHMGDVYAATAELRRMADEAQPAKEA
ncbi:hypothetical protein ACFZBC_08890 [Streptomyces luteogriseus]|uniref:hypothetical protein n=1 Tax=Streptomyces luteogriseus TaxID=68233 RepID=UPI0036E7BF43